MTSIDNYLENQYHWLYFRASKITREQYPANELRKYLKEYPYYVVAYEEGKDGNNPHVQGLLGYSELKKEISDISNEIQELFKKPNKHNAHMFIQLVSDRKSAIKYTLKEGDFIYKGFSKRLIEDLKKCSYKKEKLKQSLIENEDKLITKKINFNEFQDRYVEIHKEFNKPLNRNRTQDKYNLMMLRAGILSPTQYNDKFHQEYRDL